MDITERIRALAAAAGVRDASPDQCWVDASVSCPYGQPNGQYISRPEDACRTSESRGHGCHVYTKHFSDPEMSKEAKSEAIHEFFGEHKVTVVSELDARADELPEGSPERLALELASAVLAERKMDRNILLEDDLPK